MSPQVRRGNESELTKSAAQAVAIANRLPSDLPFYAASYSSTAQRVRTLVASTLRTASHLIRFTDSGGTDNAEEALPFEDVDDLMDRFDSGIVDALDGLLDRVDHSLAITRAQKDTPNSAALPPGSNPPISPVVRFSTGSSSSSSTGAKTSPAADILPNQRTGGGGKVIRHANIPKPQLKFLDPIDNSTDTAFQIKLREKYHAANQASLSSKDDIAADSSPLSPSIRSHLQSLGRANNDDYADNGAAEARQTYPHPYEYEIKTISYPEHELIQLPTAEQLFAPIDESAVKWIDTEQDLIELARLLETQQEFAVDLEANDYRSYQGITCLMQISTRTEDFIVDTLVLRQHMHLLGSSFADPKIAKVLHGAEMDNLWLQRDFGLYLVNLFDTYHASHVLEFSGHSLAFLLDHYAGVKLDKKYQLADWRIRPLSDEMLRYAREDTHYLLYTYDRMRNELYAKAGGNSSLIMQALCLSANTTLKVYMKPSYTADSYLFAALKLFRDSQNSSAVELLIFKHLHRWRDRIARSEDESVRFVMSNFLLHRLTQQAPRRMQDLLSACDHIPPLVKLYAKDILAAIERGRQEYLTESEEERKWEVERMAKVGRELEEKRQQRRSKHIRYDDGDGGGVVVLPADADDSGEQPSKRQKPSEDQEKLQQQLNNEKKETSEMVAITPMAHSSVRTRTSVLFDEISDSSSSESESGGGGSLSSAAPAIATSSSMFNDDDGSSSSDDADGNNSTSSDDEERLRKAELIRQSFKRNETGFATAPETPDIEVTAADITSSSAAHTVQIIEANEPAQELTVLSSKLEKRKRKKKKQLSDETPATDKRAREESFMPLTGSKDKFNGSSETDLNKKRKKKRKRFSSAADDGFKVAKKGDQSAPFDPYSQLIIDDKFKRKDPRINLRPKSAMKQMSFRNPTK